MKEYIYTTIGAFLMALGIVVFLLPCRLSSGGFSGITTILYYLYDFKIGTTTILMNLPLFVIAYFKVGKKFFSKAIYGTIVFSLILNILESLLKDIPVLTEDKLLASIYRRTISRNSEQQ